MIVDFGRISKAIYAGVGGAGAAVAAGGGVSLLMAQYIPERYMDQVPWWAFAALGVLVGVGGFITGFVPTYYAPANTPDAYTAKLIAAGRRATSAAKEK